ncbi:MAG: ABC transporter substrate-binding protein, partial [Betaproteobacteria bacterium]|nr:ABC transporter substrate-binding protein [Betaproteobacteria bacterium]
MLKNGAQTLAVLACWLGLSGPGLVMAQEAPDAFMQRLSNDMLETIKKDPALKAGDLQKIAALVDISLVEHINFKRMTASAVGPAWRQASPEQQKRLIEEFKWLLMRTYSGALSQIKDNHTILVKPLRTSNTDTEVLIRSELRGGKEPINIDYRLEKTADNASGWRIYNFNLLGVWLVDN